MELSCSYGSIPISEFLAGNSSKTILLGGGEPTKPVVIRKEDIRANRTGWRNLVKQMAKSITPSITVEVIKKQEPQILQSMKLMPEYYLQFQCAFMEYFGWKSIYRYEVDTNLVNESFVKNFMRIIDSPDTCEDFIVFWNNQIEKKYQLMEEQHDCMDKLLSHVLIMFMHRKFNFFNSDPSSSSYAFNIVLQNRQKLVADCIEDIKCLIGLREGFPNRVRSHIQEVIPFTMKEIIEYDDEEDNQMLKNYFQQKKQHKNTE